MVVCRVALLAVSSLVMSGCASTITAWKNDPLQAYDIEDPTLYAMTGDRRTAVLMNADTGKRFCAESLPDAVAAYSAASKANAAVQEKASAGFEDATYAGLLQTFQRTEIAEVYRQMGWNICLAWAQHAINDEQYLALLQQYVTGGVEAINKRASQTQTWPTVAHNSLVVTPGAAPASKSDAPKDEKKDEKKAGENASDKPGTIDLGDGVKLEPAGTASGFCIKAKPGYVGTGAITKPAVSAILPLCPAAAMSSAH